jgi:hypothetical protein
MNSIFLQLFLLLDVFFMGALAATALRHAYAHFRPHQPDKPEREKPHAPPMQNGHLPPSVREHLLEAAQANFQTVLDHSAAELAHDLEATAVQINKLVEKQGTEVIGKELEHYRTKLTELQEQTEGDIGGIRKQLDEHQAELKVKLAEEMEVEKQRLLTQIDAKLADAVGSFLLETLQHNVDLGAQSAYLTTMLEEHKADFTGKVADEA